MNLGGPGDPANPLGQGREEKKFEDLKGWHVDGDFFVHYLDSPEQGLLVVALFSDVEPNGGGATVMCPAAIGHVARYLYEHPEGVSPWFLPREVWEGEDKFVGEEDGKAGLKWFNQLAKRMWSEYGDGAFVEATGKVGDVYLLHPLMLHSASVNSRRMVRVITNPPVGLKAPMRFQRVWAKNYSLVERKTMKELGVKVGPQGEVVKGDGLGEWKITRRREKIVPEREKVWVTVKEEEKKRVDEEERRKGNGGAGEVAKKNELIGTEKNGGESGDRASRLEAEARGLEVEASGLKVEADETKAKAYEMQAEAKELKIKANELKTKVRSLRSQANQGIRKACEAKIQAIKLDRKARDLKAEARALNKEGREWNEETENEETEDEETEDEETEDEDTEDDDTEEEEETEEEEAEVEEAENEEIADEEVEDEEKEEKEETEDEKVEDEDKTDAETKHLWSQGSEMEDVEMQDVQMAEEQTEEFCGNHRTRNE